MAFFLLSLLALPLATHAQQQTGNGYSSSTSSDAGNNVTTGPFIPVRWAAFSPLCAITTNRQ